MKYIACAVLAAALVAGCDKNNSGGTTDASSTKDAINQQKDAVDAQAKDAKAQVDANRDSAKAQLDADKKKAEAQADAAKASADAAAKTANTNR
jgi:hypothetical protein